MTAEVFEEFRTYQKEKKILETNAERLHKTLREKHERLCLSLLKAFGEHVDEDELVIKEPEHLADAFGLAQDWYS
jgi:translation initiation factor 2 alpha subunit (eIF-2alpha)